MDTWRAQLQQATKPRQSILHSRESAFDIDSGSPPPLGANSCKPDCVKQPKVKVSLQWSRRQAKEDALLADPDHVVKADHVSYVDHWLRVHYMADVDYARVRQSRHLLEDV